ncbi:hypothetical protein UO65_3821 [Actinokineospora spheciospongiae]|uniref:Zinc finger CGNR domain-containing protein n=1 Tax=Actinokineospora spheciospongiae TaxID=909613 RepID=W7IWQ0_9PSEU|nr:CGNR zinc finger domain-containing protein [Actinokineospora spheciospongiae]EWC60891.1 hypothetical protein UO65_3821 [Actinokineospora spheciospongiae]
MTSAGMVLRSHTGVEYRFDPGALCLELLVTGGPGPYRRYEVLHAPDDLVAWAERSRLTPTPRLRVTAEHVAAARRFRDALLRVVHAPTPDGADLEVVNAAARRPALAPVIGPGGAKAWAGEPDGEQLLATVARDAVELLTGAFAHRVRTCSAADCRLVYVDTSRPGSRRWCSMEHCGNRHKVRAARARRTEGG